MTDPKDDSGKSFWMLGIAMMIPLILLSGPIAGYVLWRLVGIRFLGDSAGSLFIFIALGLAASALQITRLIKRIQQSDSTRKR